MAIDFSPHGTLEPCLQKYPGLLGLYHNNIESKSSMMEGLPPQNATSNKTVPASRDDCWLSSPIDLDGPLKNNETTSWVTKEMASPTYAHQQTPAPKSVKRSGAVHISRRYEHGSPSPQHLEQNCSNEYRFERIDRLLLHLEDVVTTCPHFVQSPGAVGIPLSPSYLADMLGLQMYLEMTTKDILPTTNEISLHCQSPQRIFPSIRPVSDPLRSSPTTDPQVAFQNATQKIQSMAKGNQILIPNLLAFVIGRRVIRHVSTLLSLSLGHMHFQVRWEGSPKLILASILRKSFRRGPDGFPTSTCPNDEIDHLSRKGDNLKAKEKKLEGYVLRVGRLAGILETCINVTGEQVGVKHMVARKILEGKGYLPTE